MAADFPNDLGKFFDTNHFATSITYTPNGGQATTITVVFDDAHEETDLNTGEVYNTNPTITCESADVSAEVTAATKGVFTINSTSYYPRKVMPDGTGMTKIELSKDTE